MDLILNFSHSWMASGADHIVILILLLSMIVWFWFFGDRDELNTLMNKSSQFNRPGEYNIRKYIKPNMNRQCIR